MSEEGASFHTPLLCEVLDRLSHEIRENRKVLAAQLDWFKTQSVDQITTEQLNKRLAELLYSIQGAITQTESKIMATVKEQLDEFAADVEAQFTQIGAGVDGIVASLGGLTGDVANLKKQIEDAIANGGALDQATKDRLLAIRVTANSIAQRTSAAATAAATLDQQTAEVPAPV
jgi:hypothetical protein